MAIMIIITITTTIIKQQQQHNLMAEELDACNHSVCTFCWNA